MTTLLAAATIRRASPTDLDAILAMAMAFAQSPAYAAHVDLDEDRIRTTVEQLVDQGLVLLAEQGGVPVGMLAGVVYPHPITGRQTASEIAWWVNPEARGSSTGRQLLSAFEDAGRAQGATVIEMGSWHEGLDRLYERWGFQPHERIFRKELEP